MLKARKKACIKAMTLLPKKGIIGIGSGRTVQLFLKTIAENHRKISCICASESSERAARKLGFKIEKELKPLKTNFDGADAVELKRNILIKGGGGALTKEKIIAMASKKNVIIVDYKKIVDNVLKIRVPIEVIPMAALYLKREFRKMGGRARLRNFVTENGNCILDVKFPEKMDPAALEKKIKLLPGVVEAGIFRKMADYVVIGYNHKAVVKKCNYK